MIASVLLPMIFPDSATAASSEPTVTTDAAADGDQSCCTAESWSRIDGSADSWWKLQEFLSNDAEEEMEAFFSPPTLDFVRVLIIRHGMATHNTYAGMGSLVGQDPELNMCGLSEARLVGELFMEKGILDAVDLVVVSPFTRTLQTTCQLLGGTMGPPLDSAAGALPVRGQLLPTLVQPLCAERTDALSHMGRGNRGSTAEELSRGRLELREFDLDVLEAYCEEKRIGAKNLASEGKWWHHGPHSQETEGSFQRRCDELRRWLGSLATWKRDNAALPPHVIVVSHGGVMDEGFGYTPNAPNCGFRVFDVARNGKLLRVATGEHVHVGLLAEPDFYVLAVVPHEHQENMYSLYNVELRVGDHRFTLVVRESELRANVLDVVREGLAAEEYIRLGLGGKFPDMVRLPVMEQSMYMQDYLQQLAIAMGDEAFPISLAQQIDNYLLGGLLANNAYGST